MIYGETHPGQTIYRVTWRTLDLDPAKDGIERVEDFVDIDNGYEFYQRRLKDWHSTGAKWQHVQVEGET